MDFAEIKDIKHLLRFANMHYTHKITIEGTPYIGYIMVDAATPELVSFINTSSSADEQTQTLIKEISDASKGMPIPSFLEYLKGQVPGAIITQEQA